MRRVTGSTLHVAAVCPGSFAIERVGSVGESSAFGQAMHAVIEERIKHEADLWPSDVRRIGEDHGLSEEALQRLAYLAASFQPCIPPRAAAEVSIALCRDGSVRHLDRPWRSADLADDVLIAAIVDAIWTEAAPLPRSSDDETITPRNAVWVVDWKTGDESNVPPVDRNHQIRLHALLAARWLRAQYVIPAICYVEPGPGRWEVGAPLGKAEIDAIEQEVRSIVERVESARTPELVTGAHCDHCPARVHCPAQIAEVRGLLTYTGPMDAPLSAPDASRLASMLGRAERVTRQARDVLKGYVAEHGPIELGMGMRWGPRIVTQDKLAPRATYDVLAATIGEDVADRAFSVSKRSVEHAIEEATRGSERGTRSSMVRTVLGQIRSKGGITKETVVQYRAYQAQGVETSETLQSDSGAQVAMAERYDE